MTYFLHDSYHPKWPDETRWKNEKSGNEYSLHLFFEPDGHYVLVDSGGGSYETFRLEGIFRIKREKIIFKIEHTTLEIDQLIHSKTNYTIVEKTDSKLKLESFEKGKELVELVVWESERIE